MIHSPGRSCETVLCKKKKWNCCSDDVNDVGCKDCLKLILKIVQRKLKGNKNG